MARDYSKNKGNAVSNVATIKGIQALSTKLMKENNEIDEQEKINTGRHLDNAYRYVTGDTSVGSESYNALKYQIESTQQYQDAVQTQGRGAARKSGSYDAHTLMREDERYQKDMVERSNAGVKHAGDQYNAFKTTVDSKMKDMSALDKVEYHQKKFDYERQRYQEAMKSNDQARIDAAQSDMKMCGDDLRSSIADLRKFMTEAAKKNND